MFFSFLYTGMDHVSEEGGRVLERFRLDDGVVVFETLQHDGYDADGPQSDLWDLYLIWPETGTVEAYHREDWFCGTKEPYEHSGSFPLAVLMDRLSPRDRERLAKISSQKKIYRE